MLLAFSRLYLYVHFPSDVFAGAVLGLVIGELVSRYASKLFQKRGYGATPFAQGKLLIISR